jgi:phosphonopyruvate decarboxylase
MIMHMGALTTSAGMDNLIHIVFNNGAHESVGGQPTKALELSLAKIAGDCGYKAVFEVGTADAIKSALADSAKVAGSVFIEIQCSNGSRDNLARPESSAKENRSGFMRFNSK